MGASTATYNKQSEALVRVLANEKAEFEQHMLDEHAHLIRLKTEIASNLQRNGPKTEEHEKLQEEQMQVREEMLGDLRALALEEQALAGHRDLRTGEARLQQAVLVFGTAERLRHEQEHAAHLLTTLSDTLEPALPHLSRRLLESRHLLA